MLWEIDLDFPLMYLTYFKGVFPPDTYVAVKEKQIKRFPHCKVAGKGGREEEKLVHCLYRRSYKLWLISSIIQKDCRISSIIQKGGERVKK